MKENNLGITIVLFLIILLAIVAIVFFNRDENNNPTTIKPYSEENMWYDLSQSNSNKEKTQPICLASFTTNITYSNENRIHNIKTVCEYLNNHVIKSGETFSFNDVLGPFNEEQGYVESTGFDSEGEVIKIIGGGICQVSSTLYNTALIANLQIVERHEHSAPVDYVPKGKDATVCYSEVDLKFKNTTKKDITVKSFCDGKTVKVELYEENIEKNSP